MYPHAPRVHVQFRSQDTTAEFSNECWHVRFAQSDAEGFHSSLHVSSLVSMFEMTQNQRRSPDGKLVCGPGTWQWELDIVWVFSSFPKKLLQIIFWSKD